jgi:hypothetical protein
VKTGYADTITSHRFSGVEFRPVSLYSNKKCTNPVDGFVEMRVTGSERVDEERSGMKLEYECPVCGARVYSEWNADKGLHFERSYENLPDLFEMEQRPGRKFVKPEFAQLIVDLKLRPFMLTCFEDIKPFVL